jgi:hypothetical protein
MISPEENIGSSQLFTDEEVNEIVAKMITAKSPKESIDILSAALVGRIVKVAVMEALKNAHA